MNNARVLLTKLRGGDYAHAGDKEAIDMVISKVLELAPEIQMGHCLDVGSGFGGTANYIYHLNFPSIYGIDLDEAAIGYAKNHYPKIQFTVASADEISRLFESNFFSFIYMFNVLYAIEDKPSLLKQLYSVAKPGALLVLFDYTTEQRSFRLKDLAGKPMYPIVVNQLKEDLSRAGWEVVEITDLSTYFLNWYRTLLDKLDKEREILAQQFSEADISRVNTTFTTVYEWLKNSEMGGAVIYARKVLLVRNQGDDSNR